MAAVSRWKVEDRLGPITCPALAIAGEHEFIPLALEESYTSRLPDAQLAVIQESGHFTPLDDPAAFNHAVMEFLTRQG